MVNYSKAIIYKLCCKDPEIIDIYVGSTCDKYTRKAQHKSATNKGSVRDCNKPLYKFIREHGGWDNWEFAPVEVYPCENKNQLLIRERYWYETLNTTLNNLCMIRECEERKNLKKQRRKNWYSNNKDYVKNKGKDRYEKKKEEILRRHKEKYVCECGVELTKGATKAIHIKSKAHQNWLKSGDKYKPKGEQYICNCGSTIQNIKVKVSRHLKTIKHQTWEQQPEPNLIFVD